MIASQTVSLTLASSSPRRSELLSQLGWQFRVVAPEIDESILDLEAAQDYVHRVSIEKAKKVFDLQTFAEPKDAGLRLVLASDTVVVLRDEILGKPSDIFEAKEMLRRLSGNTHQVLTGIALVLEPDKTGSISEGAVDLSSLEFSVGSCDLGGRLILSSVISTDVLFKELSADEIDRYCSTQEPLDKAGSYGIQGQAAAFVKAIKGSYSGVVGLPLFETNELLEFCCAFLIGRNECVMP